MTRYVIGPDAAIRLARDQAVSRGEHQLLAPALLRSQVLSLLYQAVRRGELTRRDAEARLSYVHGLPIRLLDGLVLHNVAWKAAAAACRAERSRGARRRWRGHRAVELPFGWFRSFPGRAGRPAVLRREPRRLQYRADLAGPPRGRRIRHPE